MTKKNLLLILFAISLAVVYAVWFSDWFQPKTMHIFHTTRNLRPNPRRAGPAPTFAINRAMRLTDIKVVPLAVFETNKNTVPLWHLVSDSNSVPVKMFIYGQFIGGMRPAFKGVRAEPLQTNVTYRLFIIAGNIKGEHDFEVN